MIHMVPHYTATGALKSIDLIIEMDSIAAFKRLVDKALNCWDEAPPECKELGDYLTHGKILQDYRRSTFDNSGTYAVEIGSIDKFPGLVSLDLSICSECGGRGLHHLHNCVVLKKN